MAIRGPESVKKVSVSHDKATEPADIQQILGPEVVFIQWHFWSSVLCSSVLTVKSWQLFFSSFFFLFFVHGYGFLVKLTS